MRFGTEAVMKSGNEMTIEQDIYRIVQEALNNAIKHALRMDPFYWMEVSRNTSCLSYQMMAWAVVPGSGEQSQGGWLWNKTMRELR